MKEVKIGILGFGTVGAGVVEGILKNGDLMAERTGIRPVVAKIADLDVETDRGVAVADGVLTTDAVAVIDDPNIDVIVELIGGVTIAKNFVLRALKNGKQVVTANKALLADFGEEIYRTAQENGAGIYYEAAVGGGIPVLRSQRAGLIGNRIESIYGILNGTCNYILTRMEREGLPFDEILADAQALGYAETPPDLDIDGVDTAHKAVVLASMAYGAPVPMDACPTAGIRGLSSQEIDNAEELGYRIKLLAIIKDNDGEVELSVEPTLVPEGHMIASVSDSFNAVFVKGDIVDDTMYYGRGAGRLPTGSAVIGDIMEAAADRLNEAGVPVSVTMMLQKETLAYCPAEKIEKRCYIRLSLLDQPGSMGKVMESLGRYNISIASVVQKERHTGGYVPVVILTHKAKEVEFASAIQEINSLSVSEAEPVRMRIEDFES
ncbi:homoserine dehydrogenase [Tichowtungia aerotolerans]|uniref:Homoserine dehydrogenase n=1 Tax=Tichowtungia aerotolerans TaxID=2697043 RepID=A0A6P1M745_9BACT|nr:homoserine dehydrogenase [Tichowtungia aerotolerans]QHI69671.1 homoserine dehydrogenase [Tichowtungia aerotolerans]